MGAAATATTRRKNQASLVARKGARHSTRMAAGRRMARKRSSLTVKGQRGWPLLSQAPTRKGMPTHHGQTSDNLAGGRHRQRQPKNSRPIAAGTAVRTRARKERISSIADHFFTPSKLM